MEWIWNIYPVTLYLKTSIVAKHMAEQLALSLSPTLFFFVGVGSPTHYWAGINLSWIRLLSVISHILLSLPSLWLCRPFRGPGGGRSLGSSVPGLPRGRRQQKEYPPPPHFIMATHELFM